MTTIHVIASIKYLSSMSLSYFMDSRKYLALLGKKGSFMVLSTHHIYCFFYVHHLHPLAFLIFIFMVMSTIGEHSIYSHHSVHLQLLCHMITSQNQMKFLNIVMIDERRLPINLLNQSD